MTREERAAIENRLALSWDRKSTGWRAPYATDVPVLLAEIDRLRAALEQACPPWHTAR